MKLKFQIVIFCFLFCTFSNVTAQKEVLNLPTNYKSTLYNGKESLAISNKKTGDLVVFVEDYEKTNAYLINKDFKLISKIQTDSLESSFKKFEGYQINKDGTYAMFFKNNTGKKYGVLHLDFNLEKGIIKTLGFKLKREKYLKGITANDRFYIMSVSNDNSSKVHFYAFKDDFEVLHKETVPFSFANFLNYKDWEYARETLNSPLNDIVTIDNTITNPIDITSRRNKLYIQNDTIILTLDREREKTKVFTMSLETFKKTYDEYKQPEISEKREYNSNSYIFDDKIFQIYTTSEQMKFVITSLETKEIFKEIDLKKGDEITFKNSPIMQDRSTIFFGEVNRELEKSNQFLRKIAQGDIGISVNKDFENYKITLGSKLKVRSLILGVVEDLATIPLASFRGLSIAFNPAGFAYHLYGLTKSTYINCLFNDSFEHIEGDVVENTFDKIIAFEEAFNKNDKEKNESSFDYDKFQNIDFSMEPRLKNVFRHSGKLYFGYIDTIDKNYHLIEFSN